MNACCTGVNVFSGFHCWFEGNDVKVKNVNELLCAAFLFFVFVRKALKMIRNFTPTSSVYFWGIKVNNIFLMIKLQLTWMNLFCMEIIETIVPAATLPLYMQIHRMQMMIQSCFINQHFLNWLEAASMILG